MPTVHGSWLLAAIVVLGTVLSPCRAADELIDSPMYKSPELPTTPLIEMVLSDKTIGLWLRALERPDADTRCRAADAIALAHQRGRKGLAVTVGPLRAALERPDQPETVRMAVARTLIALDARETAPSLLAQAQAGSQQLRDLIESALATWDYRPARAIWLSRLRDPATSPRGLIRTIQALAAVREQEARTGLLELMRSDQTAGPTRLEAARALGVLVSEGLERDAERLAAAAGPRNLPLRLSAAWLLQAHSSKEAVQILRRLIDDPEPAVIAISAARLVAIEPDVLVAVLPRLLDSPDAQLRLLGVQVLARRPTQPHLRLLADRLDDVHPEVRSKARQSLRELAANAELRSRVIEEATRMLGTRKWRALEQASILLTQLDYKPAVARLLELLPSERPEVFVAAAWGLRKLAVPETLPEVLRYTTAEQSHASRKGYANDMADHQLAQLHQLLGQMRYKPADAVLRAYVPRRMQDGQDGSWPEARAAAIWALGLIHEGHPTDELQGMFEYRVTDLNPPAEDERVRRMAAIALGRIQGNKTLVTLRFHCQDHEPPIDSVGAACHWAIEKITGEAALPPKVVRKMDRDYFMVSDE
jgi:HEAT repeat protein